jgi:ferric iron reductase protein FhuF
MLELLRPLFPGDLARYGEALRVGDRAPVAPSIAQWLADPAHLSGALARHAEFLEGALALKPVTLEWMSRYLTALLPPIVALCSVLKYRVPLSWHDMGMTLNECGAPTAFIIEKLGTAAPHSNTAERYDALVWRHLEPLSALLARQTRVPIKILRGNVRRALMGVFNQALELLGHDPCFAPGLIEDRQQLLQSPYWPDGRRNPLFFRHRQMTVPFGGGLRLLTLHASCCLAYQLPRTGYCGACPLAPEHRRVNARTRNPIPQ